MSDLVAGAASSAADISLKLYEMLFLLRKSEDYIIKYYHEDEMKSPMHMTMGQEAIPVAVCAALGDTGDIFSSYRSHGPFLARTGDIEGFFAELYGRRTGVAGGKAGSMHLADIDKGHLCSTAIVSSGIPVAVGTAFANRQLKTGRMTATFFGDGAVDEGNFWESLNIACAMRIPVLFVCEDNGLAVHTSQATRHGYRSIVEVVSTFDCIVVHDDSNDVEQLYTATSRAIRQSLAESRPVFLHYECYRYLEHVGINPDFDAGYRSKAEYDEYVMKDSLTVQRRRVLAAGFSEADVADLEARLEDRIQKAVEAAKTAPLPDPAALYAGVFHAQA